MLPNGSAVNREHAVDLSVQLPFVSMSQSEAQQSGGELAARIREAMADFPGLTQGKLERMCGFPGRGYINKIIHGSRGKRPSHDTVERVAKALHVRPEWLATGELPKRPEGEATTPRERALATGREYGVLSETFAELERRYPEAAFPDRDPTWWLYELLGLDREVRLRLAEERAAKRPYRSARAAGGE